jgi:hypothetical protein
MTLADNFHNDPRDNWLGLLKVFLDLDRAQFDIRADNLYSAAHQASWPTHVIIDADEAKRLMAEKQPGKSPRQKQPSLGSIATIPAEIPEDRAAASLQADAAPTQVKNLDIEGIAARLNVHIESALAAIASAQEALAQLIEMKNKITGGHGG